MLQNDIINDEKADTNNEQHCDNALYEQALAMAEPDIAKTEIFREAIKTFVRVRAAKRQVTFV